MFGVIGVRKDAAGTRKAAILSLVLVTILVTSLVPAVAAAPAYAQTRQIFGISSALGSLDSATRDRAMAMLADAGCTWTRVGAYWPWIDRNGKANRDWDITDGFVASAKARNQVIVGSIVGYAQWASGNSDGWYVPADVSAFADFARDTVNRYKADVHYWEIWNEPNNDGFWKPSPNPAHFAKLLRAGYLAVKQADPSAKVVLGGIDRNDYGFLNNVYAALKAYPDAAANDNFFDILAVHPYADDRAPESTDPSAIWPGVDRNFSGLPKMKAAMEAQGDANKHIMVTEVAWVATAENAGSYWAARVVGEATQADYLTRAYQMAQDWPWLDCMMWYGFKNWNDEELPFSLVGADLSARPSYTAFKAAAAGGVSVTGPGTEGDTGDTGETATGGTTGETGTTDPEVREPTKTKAKPRTRVVRRGQVGTVYASVSPNQAYGKAKAMMYLGGRWRTVKYLKLNRYSRALFRFRARHGRMAFRVIYLGSTAARPSWTAPVIVDGR